jgi:hypothetical protein
MGEALSVRGQLRLLTVDVSDRRPLMDITNTDPTVILLRDESDALIPYRIDEAFTLDEKRTGYQGDYTVLVKMDDEQAEPVIVRALDADVPSFVGIEDEEELQTVRSEYQARIMRRGFKVV